jgi:hypothetical protein
MDEQLETAPVPQIVDLGDAKELTMGYPDVVFAEENATIPLRLEP